MINITSVIVVSGKNSGTETGLRVTINTSGGLFIASPFKTNKSVYTTLMLKSVRVMMRANGESIVFRLT